MVHLVLIKIKPWYLFIYLFRWIFEWKLCMMFLWSSTFPFKGMSEHFYSKYRWCGQDTDNNIHTNSPFADVKWSHVHYVHQSRTIWGCYTWKGYCGYTTNLVEWSPSKVHFFSLALHMDGYKEHGCQVHVEEATSPTKLRSFCLHWKENGIRIP